MRVRMNIEHDCSKYLPDAVGGVPRGDRYLKWREDKTESG